MQDNKDNTLTSRKPLRWISLVLVLASGTALACTTGCENDEDGGAERATLLADVRGRTSNGADIVVECMVEYKADIGGDVAYREGVVRKMVQDQSNSTLLRHSLMALRTDKELLGRALTDELNALVDQNPQTRGVFDFDITCGEPALDPTTTS